MTELKINDQVKVHYGPYVGWARVIDIGEHGAVLALPTITVLNKPSAKDVVAPDGTVLAKAPLGFIGRAHWASAEVVSER